MVELHSGGPCPVCPDGSEAVLLARRDAEPLVFYCPHCGCAWRCEGEFDENAEPFSLGELAPDGVRLPSPEQIQRTPGVRPHAFGSSWSADIEALLP